MVYFELEYLVPFQEMLTPASVNAFIFECNQMFDLIFLFIFLFKKHKFVQNTRPRTK